MEVFSNVSNVKTLTDLDINCLEKIFIHCDLLTLISLSKVCTYLNRVVCQVAFSKFTSFTFHWYHNCDKHKLLEIAQCIGPYLRSVKLQISCSFDDETLPFIEFLTELNSFIGEHISHLTIISPSLPQYILDKLQTVLKRITSLKIRAENTDMSYDMNLRSICTNLRDLHIQQDTQFVLNSGPWSKLESLSLGDNEFLWEGTFKNFMDNNPQLKQLKIAAYNCDLHLADIADRLHNLTKLTLFQSDSDLSAETVLHLQRLSHLDCLTLLRVNPDEFDSILTSLGKLTTIKTLKIQADSDCNAFASPTTEVFINLAKSLSQLQFFHVGNVCLEQKALIDFVRYAPELLEFHLHLEQNPITDGVLQEIGIIRQNAKEAKPLKLFLELSDINKWITVNSFVFSHFVISIRSICMFLFMFRCWRRRDLENF